MNTVAQLLTENLLDTTKTIAADLFKGVDYPFEVLPKIKEYILQLQEKLDKTEFNEITTGVFVHKTATVAPTAFIAAPCIIDAKTEVRHCAYIRGNAIVGKNCVVGNSCELKNVVIFDNVQVPHYNYVGDSVLGYHSHMGAGSITSNVKSDKTPVKIKYKGKCVETGLKKMGAIVGDYVEVGCNSVLNPGTVIGRESNVYPLSMVRGYVAENSIYKCKNEIVAKF